MEQQRLADAEKDRKEAENDQRFAALPHEEQVNEMLRKEQAQRAQAHVQHKAAQTVIDFIGGMAGPKVYEIR